MNENTSDVMLFVFMCSCVYMCVNPVRGWVHVLVCACGGQRAGRPRVSSDAGCLGFLRHGEGK